MPGPARHLGLRLAALVVLAIVIAAIGGSAEAARHHHDGAGLYDDYCPLQVLVAVDRAGLVAATVSTRPVEVAATLAALPLVLAPARRPASDTRFRAPPAR